jgi:hypothetical protein
VGVRCVEGIEESIGKGEGRLEVGVCGVNLEMRRQCNFWGRARGQTPL